MLRNLLLGVASILLFIGCSSYRGPVWVMRVDSSPTGARIFCGTSGEKGPREYLGTTPCNAGVPAEAGGKYLGHLIVWAVPPTNTPDLHEQRISFSGYIKPVKLPSALYFDLTRVPGK